MATNEKRRIELHTLVRSLGGAPERVTKSSTELAREAQDIGQKIYRETMHGKIKLTLDA